MQSGLVSKLGTEAHLDWSKSKIAEPTNIAPKVADVQSVVLCPTNWKSFSADTPWNTESSDS